MRTAYVNSGLIQKPYDWDMGFHEHEGFEISVVLEGSGQFECRGVRTSIEPGHVVIIPGSLPHNYIAHTEIRFGVLMAAHMSPETIRLFDKLTPSGQASVLWLSPLVLDQYDRLFRQWLRFISEPLEDEADCFNAWVGMFILFLLQHRSKGSSGITIASSAEWIRTRLTSEIAIGELARQCGLSESAYRTRFKAAYGMSPKQFQQSCRASEAKWLLRSTDKPIQAIAELVGFAAVHSFSAWFQKIEGRPPTEWRKIQQGHPGTGFNG